MKKILILVFVSVVTVLTSKELNSKKNEGSPLLLFNIEALASNDEHVDVGRCIGTGSVDCPATHDKVENVYSGYSLEY